MQVPGPNTLEDRPLPQQTPRRASKLLGLHRIKSCYPFISLEITAAFHSHRADTEKVIH